MSYGTVDWDMIDKLDKLEAKWEEYEAKDKEMKLTHEAWERIKQQCGLSHELTFMRGCFLREYGLLLRKYNQFLRAYTAEVKAFNAKSTE